MRKLLTMVVVMLLLLNVTSIVIAQQSIESTSENLVFDNTNLTDMKKKASIDIKEHEFMRPIIDDILKGKIDTPRGQR